MSLRGFVIILLLLYLLIVPALGHTDIVAWVLVVTVFLVLLTTSFLTALTWYPIRKNTSISFGLPGADIVLYSKQPVSLIGIIEPIRLLPFVTMKFEISFGDQTKQTITAEIRGRFHHNKARIPFTLTFPHRGNYSVSSVRWSVSDPFGFVVLPGKFRVHHEQITITPPEIQGASLPVFTSSFREGDTTTHINEPLGDMYDLKKYHPSDGLKKIVWKIFARSGELLSRHPERTMTPEGSVCIFCFAPSYDDASASLTYQYCKELEEAGIELCVGCLGLQSRSPARSSTAAMELLINCTWDAESYDEASIQGDITSYLSQTKPLTPSRVVIIADSRDNDAAEGLHVVGKFLQSLDIEPLFIIPKFVAAPQVKKPKNSFVKRIFVEVERPKIENVAKDSFNRIAAQYGWDVFAI